MEASTIPRQAADFRLMKAMWYSWKLQLLNVPCDLTAVSKVKNELSDSVMLAAKHLEEIH